MHCLIDPRLFLRLKAVDYGDYLYYPETIGYTILPSERITNIVLQGLKVNTCLLSLEIDWMLRQSDIQTLAEGLKIHPTLRELTLISAKIDAQVLAEAIKSNTVLESLKLECIVNHICSLVILVILF